MAIHRILPTTYDDASCYFDFSVSGIVCQAGLPRPVVAKHKGIIRKVFMVFVEKHGELLFIILVSAFVRDSLRAGKSSLKFSGGKISMSSTEIFPKIY